MAERHHKDNPPAKGAHAAKHPAAKPKEQDPPHPERAPGLIKTDTTVPGRTHYLKVTALDTGGGPKMGVFVPKVVKTPGTVDVILYVHGNKVLLDGQGNRVWHTDWDIENIWSHFTFPIREQLNQSGKPYILVAPTLGARDQAGQMGDFSDIVIDQALDGLGQYDADYKQQKIRPKLGRLILAGHSGAGPVMLEMANSLRKYKDNLSEVWGFDVMYEEHECEWAQLASRRGGPRMYMYYAGTRRRSLDLAVLSSALDNVYVMEGSDTVMKKGKKESVLVKHDFLVERFFPDRLQRGSKDLDDTSRRRATFEEAKNRKALECRIDG